MGQKRTEKVALRKAEDILPGMVSPLLSWYHENARILPWRMATGQGHPIPYQVWLSEVMLQQTRVEAVKPYFARFLRELPDIPALAAAPEAQLMKLWEGLGYYSRARNLQKAARIVTEQYGGELPASYKLLLELPGFGAYTAGAVASIAFGIPVPAVDGNVLRVVSRLLASREDITRPEVKAAVTECIRAVMPSGQASRFNQALMELGAIVCVPNGPPKCGSCPLRFLCEGERQGIAAELPVKAAKKARRIENRTVFLLVSEEKAAIRKRDEKGLLAGLWEFPNMEGTLTAEEAKASLAGWGVEAVKIQSLKPAKHIFSHIEWHMTGYLIRLSGWTEEAPPLTWASRRELLEHYTVPSAFRAYYDEALNVLAR